MGLDTSRPGMSLSGSKLPEVTNQWQLLLAVRQPKIYILFDIHHDNMAN